MQPNKSEKTKDFIIGSLYRYGDTHALDAVQPRRHTLNEMLAQGEEAVAQNRADNLIDLSRLAQDLRARLSQWTHSPIVRAVTLMRALEQLPYNERALLATTVVYDFTTLELTQIAIGGLEALEKACARAESSRADQALSKLKQIKGYLAPVTVGELEGQATWVSLVGPIETQRAFRDFQTRARNGQLVEGTKWVVLLPPEEAATPRAAMVEYLKRCVAGAQRLSSKEMTLASAQDYEGNDVFQRLKKWVSKATVWSP